MEYFDMMSKNFDTDERTTRAVAIADKIRALIADGGTKSAIEFGCGTGLVGFQLIDIFQSLVLMDSSAGMIGKVEEKLQSLKAPNASALLCDLSVETPENLRVDYIFSSMALHHVGDTEAILRTFRDLLNDGGHLLIVDLDKEDGSFHSDVPGFDGHNGFEQSSLRDLTTRAGFGEVTMETFYHDVKAADGGEAPYSLFIMDATKQ